MTNNPSLPELKVTVFSDYICPFCFVGHHRLMRLRDSYDLKINWCFLEIHPETPAEGEAIDALEYPSETWRTMMQGLQQVAKEEGLVLPAIQFITNSRNALLLSEAAKQAGKTAFYQLHQALFRAYFIEQKNISERTLLATLAKENGVSNEIIETAWHDSSIEKRLQHNYHTARQYNIESVPAFVFGKQVLTGVVSEKAFRQSAEALLKLQPTPAISNSS